MPWSWVDAVGAAAFTLLLTWITAQTLVALLGRDDTTRQAVTLVSGGIATTVGVVLYVHLRFPGSLRRLLGPARPSVGHALAGAGHGVLAFAVLNIGIGTLLTVLSRHFGFELPDVQEPFREAAEDPALAQLLLFLAVVLAPLAEELFFRGLLFQALLKRMRFAGAAWLSGLLFALVHGEWLAILLFIPLGFYFAWLFHRRGSLIASVSAHAAFNLLGVLILLARTAEAA